MARLLHTVALRLRKHTKRLGSFHACALPPPPHPAPSRNPHAPNTCAASRVLPIARVPSESEHRHPDHDARRAATGCRWNKCLNHLLALARAHQEALMLDAFYSAATSAVDPDCRRALKARPAPVPAGLPRSQAGVAGCGRQEVGTG